jgi:CheY-like chemotaxis protein
LMGGEIGYQGQSGVGAVFWFELPVSQGVSKPMAESSAKARDYPSMDDSQRHKILYIEDNPANLMLMEHIVGLLDDVELLSAHTAELGILLINKENPDLVLMDINLPGMGGIEAIRAIRASRDTARVPVVAISAAAMPHDIERAVNAGFQDYLTKPLDIPMALQVINETLRRSSRPSG